MPTHSKALPQLGGGLFLTDGGLETTLIFHDRLELPDFAAFRLLASDAGCRTLEAYYERYLAIALEAGTGFILESPTWRASDGWGRRAGLAPEALAGFNRQAIGLMRTLRTRHAATGMPIVVSGCVGPRGDGYEPGRLMTVAEAGAYHARQIEAFAEAGADMVAATTMTNVPEAVGVALAARAAGLPSAVSFTVETDGRLPTGEPLGRAIEAVDEVTGGGPAYYMINCAHPTHFVGVLDGGAGWISRLRGIRANASCRSHAELNEAADLDDGNPKELGEMFAELRRHYPWFNVLGGCCGTDHRHVQAIADACRAAAEAC